MSNTMTQAQLRNTRIRARKITASRTRKSHTLRNTLVIVAILAYTLTSISLGQDSAKATEALVNSSLASATTFEVGGSVSNMDARQADFAELLCSDYWSIDNGTVTASIQRIPSKVAVAVESLNGSGEKVNSYSLPFYYVLTVESINMDKAKDKTLAAVLEKNTAITLGTGEFVYSLGLGAGYDSIPAPAMLKYFSEETDNLNISLSDVKLLLKRL